MTMSSSQRVQLARAPGGRRRYAQVARYAVAFVAPTCAFAVQALVARQVPPTPALFFCPAVLVAAVCGGVVPGLIATALSVFILADRFLPPRGAMRAGAWALQVGIELVIFVGLSLAICFLVERSRAVRRAAREAT